MKRDVVAVPGLARWANLDFLILEGRRGSDDRCANLSTEFEDHWPYRAAPADLYFHRSADQGKIRRRPFIRYVSTSFPGDVTLWALATVMGAPVLLRRRKR